MVADSRQGFLSNLLRSGAKPFGAAPRMADGHANSRATAPHDPTDFSSAHTTVDSIVELSLEEVTERTTEPGREAKQHPAAAAQSHQSSRAQTEATPPASAMKAEVDSAPSRSVERAQLPLEQQQDVHQTTETLSPPVIVESREQQPAIHAVQHIEQAAQIRPPQERPILNRQPPAPRRAEQLNEDSVTRDGASHPFEIESAAKPVQAMIAGNVSAETSRKVSGAFADAQPIESHQVGPERRRKLAREAHPAPIAKPPAHETLGQGEARPRDNGAQRLTINRLEVQIIQQPPAAHTEPAAPAPSPRIEAHRPDSLYRHHLGRFYLGL